MTLVGSLPDPYQIDELAVELSDNTGNQHNFDILDGRTEVTPIIVPGQKTAVLICIGQSNTANFVGGVGAAYTPSNSLVHNFNFLNGGVYEAQDPLLGAGYEPTYNVSDGGGGGYPGRLGDKLINAGTFQRVILVPISIGTTTVAMWAPGGTMNSRITATCARLAAVNLPTTAMLWSQGELDAEIGTTQAEYAASLLGVIATFRACGVTAPFFPAIESYNGGLGVNPAIQAAQAQVVDGVTVFAGADADSIGPSDRGGTHWNAAGADAFATLWATILESHF